MYTILPKKQHQRIRNLRIVVRCVATPATFWQIGDGAICFRFSSEIEAGKEEVFRVGYVVGWVFDIIIATIRAGLLMRI